jgi:hypothetical protein
MEATDQFKPRRQARIGVLLVLLLVSPALSGCHVTRFRVGTGGGGFHQETMHQYYLFFGLLQLNEVDIQRVVADVSGYDVEVGFSYRGGVWTLDSFGDFLVSLLFLPLTVTRQAITVKT